MTLPGQFMWFDLSAPDASQAREFDAAARYARGLPPKPVTSAGRKHG